MSEKFSDENEILLEKWKVQKDILTQANGDISEYNRIINKIAEEAIKKFNMKFNSGLEKKQ